MPRELDRQLDRIVGVIVLDWADRVVAHVAPALEALLVCEAEHLAAPLAA